MTTRIRVSLLFALLAPPVQAQKIYWTMGGEHKIQRANLDGSNEEDVLVLGVGASPEDIALDTEGGKMYWTDFLAASAYRANLNGSNVESVVSEYDHKESTVFGIALDLTRRKLYWTFGGGDSPGRLGWFKRRDGPRYERRQRRANRTGRTRRQDVLDRTECPKDSAGRP